MKIQSLKHRIILALVMIAWLFIAMQIVSLIVSRATTYSIGYSSNFGKLFVHQPYCAIDPMCIDIVTHNPGPYIHGMPSISGYSQTVSQHAAAFSSTNFAWSNYILFMLLLMAIVWNAGSFIEKGVTRNAILIFVTAWCVHEHGRWENLREMGTATGPGVEFIQTIALMTLSLVLLLAVWFAARRRREIDIQLSDDAINRVSHLMR